VRSLPERILVASSNAKKLEELRALFADLPTEVVGPDERLPEVVEDAETFVGNAKKKAIEIARHSGLATIADDSGLEVDALDGAPGVRSARFAADEGRPSEPDKDSANNALLLEKLAGVAERGARFRCVLVLAAPDGTVLESTEGTVEGRILETPRGDGGFGYDPLFVPEGESRTMAELTSAEKAALSHRGRAARAMADRLARR
jgi:XTP/dITP diphosphohydrolase